jgi:hypothetical protein
MNLFLGRAHPPILATQRCKFKRRYSELHANSQRQEETTMVKKIGDASFPWTSIGS